MKIEIKTPTKKFTLKFESEEALKKSILKLQKP
ncbi:hypothetical protein QE441_000636 [Chryseobacterium sp. SORGH_AS909]|uniref:Uncharacterized protein n=1 Tax=Chryseobacterium camelliae TaxID=1265445 RepID=A0ABU0TK95_9FLAO|nr:hypothetical protein [Chryseobacterium camelliae]MDQ1101398.1 hypothetical protein [Chryseobacterium sp. SORGH_AS_1048]MDR6084842.1 hypothetical protein [Chryseobacterium sp. SORGH_AS_0909]MDR6129192.1 hypothetical protein [Chryseobacterium sp. SORGH_AS_1175]MDT3408677.1 hypothetical protein [Pseudacidovorax intermedius]